MEDLWNFFLSYSLQSVIVMFSRTHCWRGANHSMSCTGVVYKRVAQEKKIVAREIFFKRMTKELQQGTYRYQFYVKKNLQFSTWAVVDYGVAWPLSILINLSKNIGCCSLRKKSNNTHLKIAIYHSCIFQITAAGDKIRWLIFFLSV